MDDEEEEDSSSAITASGITTDRDSDVASTELSQDDNVKPKTKPLPKIRITTPSLTETYPEEEEGLRRISSSVRIKRTRAVGDIPRWPTRASDEVHALPPAKDKLKLAVSPVRRSVRESKIVLPFIASLDDDGELTDIEEDDGTEERRRPSESQMYQAEDEEEATEEIDTEQHIEHEQHNEEEIEEETAEDNIKHDPKPIITDHDQSFVVSIDRSSFSAAPHRKLSVGKKGHHNETQNSCERVLKCALDLEKRLLDCETRKRSSVTSSEKRGSCQKSKHGDSGSSSFPFKISSTGELVVDKSMVVFANDHVAVLVTDPTRTKVCVKQEQLDAHAIKLSRDNGTLQSQLSIIGTSNDLSTSCVTKSCQTVSSGRSDSCAGLLLERLSQHKQELKQPARTSCLPGFPPELQHRLRRAIHADTRIVIGRKEFPCHSVILQMYSKYFDEFKRPVESIQRIRLPEVAPYLINLLYGPYPEIISAEDFPSLMDWILLDEPHKVRVINRQNVVALYTAATCLAIPELKAQCDKFIKEKIENGDPLILKMYQEARCRPKCEGLLKGLSNKLAELFPVLFKTKQFLELGTEDFVVVIDSDDLKIDRELDVFHAASRWLLYDWENRNRYAVRVMRCVRFGLMSPLQLTQIRHCAEASNSMDGYHNIFSFQEIKDMVNDALTYSIFKENYECKPKELHRWVDWSKVHAPRPRKYLLKSSRSRELSTVLVPSNLIVSKCSAPAEKENDGHQRPPHPSCLRNHAVESQPECSATSPSTQSISRASVVNACGRRRSSIRDPFTLASVLRFKNNLPDDKHDDGW